MDYGAVLVLVLPAPDVPEDAAVDATELCTLLLAVLLAAVDATALATLLLAVLATLLTLEPTMLAPAVLACDEIFAEDFCFDFRVDPCARQAKICPVATPHLASMNVNHVSAQPNGVYIKCEEASGPTQTPNTMKLPDTNIHLLMYFTKLNVFSSALDIFLWFTEAARVLMMNLEPLTKYHPPQNWNTA